MIITQLQGGLGNQMFQYAAGRALSLRLGIPLFVDTTWYSARHERPFLLSKFHIAAEIASQKDLARFNRHHVRRAIRRVNNVIQRLFPKTYLSEFGEVSQHYQQSFENIDGPVYLSGYFQSEKYFEEYAEIIHRDFTLLHPMSSSSEIVAEQICRAENPVSIHVRRGDYLLTSKPYMVCSLEYYNNAIGKITESVPNPCFYVFSDDPEWTRTNLKVNFPAVYVTHNSKEPTASHEDLWLMSLCHHHIIANSTFSWWGAWLSKHSEKTVIAPARWFHAKERESDDLLPESWIKVSNMAA